MRVLMCGDVVGRSGRHVLYDELPRLRREWALDFVVVNGENAAGGFGITAALCGEFYEAGVDVITTGNHVWDQREIIPYIGRDTRLLRPQNYPSTAPGTGTCVATTQRDQRVLVINVMGRLFMEPLDDPFAALDAALDGHELGTTVDAIIVDVHGEATSEKQAIGHYLDGRVSLVAGTHTHAPTADTCVLDGGTGFQTDIGMCGDYNSVIGSDRTLWITRMRSKMPVGRIPPSEGPGTLSGLFAELLPRTGLPKRVAPVIVGARLAQRHPDAI